MRKHRLLQGHVGYVYCVTFSPDGKWLASAGADELIKVWDVRSGQERLAIKGPGRGNTGVVFSPDGNRLASASPDATVKIWDASNGKELHSLKGEDYVGHVYTPHSVSFSPSGKRVAAIWGKSVAVWDAKTGQTMLTLKGHTDSVNSVAYSTDGKRLASAGEDGTIKIWDAQTGRELRALHFERWTSPGNVTYSPDGRYLAASWLKCVRLWDCKSGLELRKLEGHSYHVYSVAFTSDGGRLASTTNVSDIEDRGLENELKVWDTATGQVILDVSEEYDRFISVAFSHDGKWLAVAGEYGITVWDAAPERESHEFEGDVATSAQIATRPALAPDTRHEMSQVRSFIHRMLCKIFGRDR